MLKNQFPPWIQDLLAATPPLSREELLEEQSAACDRLSSAVDRQLAGLSEAERALVRRRFEDEPDTPTMRRCRAKLAASRDRLRSS